MSNQEEAPHTPDEYSVQSLRLALEVYLSGRSGLRFEALATFAGPLFDLYDVDWRGSDAADVSQQDGEELATIVAILDTARLLWTFFVLEEDERDRALPALEDALLGRQADDGERTNLLVLFSLLEEHFYAFTPEQRREAENVPGYSVPPFDTLLRRYCYPSGEMLLPAISMENFAADMPDHLAAFAQPLFEDEQVQLDPDTLDDRLTRAQAYWELAQAPADEFAARLSELEAMLGQTADERRHIRREAEQMVQRFRSLFPEKSSNL